MRDYELVLIVSPEVPEENVSATIDRVTHFIAGRGGSITEVNRWGRRKLAYPIRNFTEGDYVVTQFKLEPGKATELEESLRIPEDILRHLLIRLGD